MTSEIKIHCPRCGARIDQNEYDSNDPYGSWICENCGYGLPGGLGEQTDTEKIVCGACQATIKPGTEIMVTMEKFSHHERTWPACSEECADILRESA